MAVSIALTAAAHGAVLENHVEVLELLKKQQNGKEALFGAVVRDKLTGDKWKIRAKGVVNAAGPFVGTEGVLGHVQELIPPQQTLFA